MEQFIIQGRRPLRGEVIPSGNKNAALPLLSACLMTDEPVILHNVPEIRDVQAMRHLIESLGIQVLHILLPAILAVNLFNLSVNKLFSWKETHGYIT